MRAVLILHVWNVLLYRKECKMFGLDRLKTVTLQLKGWSTRLGVLVFLWALFASPSHRQNLVR